MRANDQHFYSVDTFKDKTKTLLIWEQDFRAQFTKSEKALLPKEGTREVRRTRGLNKRSIHENVCKSNLQAKLLF